MLIPHTLLDPHTLERLLEDFVTRDGTDNGYEATLEQRVLANATRAGRVVGNVAAEVAIG